MNSNATEHSISISELIDHQRKLQRKRMERHQEIREIMQHEEECKRRKVEQKEDKKVLLDIVTCKIKELTTELTNVVAQKATLHTYEISLEEKIKSLKRSRDSDF
jgi:CRISPR/Cas system-associated protein Csm6